MARDTFGVCPLVACAYEINTAGFSFPYLEHGIISEELHALGRLAGADIQGVRVNEVRNRGSRSQKFAHAGTPLNREKASRSSVLNRSQCRPAAVGLDAAGRSSMTKP